MAIQRNNAPENSLRVEIQLNIGLDYQDLQAVVNMLNIILADVTLLTQKTRSAYWNVSGANFFELQSLYHTQTQQLNTIADDIAERVRMLGGAAVGSLHEFIHSARLQDQPGAVPEILDLLADHEALIRFLREDAKKCSEEHEDEGTFGLLVNVLRLHEKMAWMLRSHKESELMAGEEIIVHPIRGRQK